MRISKIDDLTMECLLTAEDVKKKGISTENLTYSSPVMRSLMRELITFLEKKYSFGSKDETDAPVDIIPMYYGGIDIIFSIGAYMDDADPRYSVFSESTSDEPSESETNDPLSGGIGDILKSIFESITFEGNPSDKYLLHHDSTDMDDSWAEAFYTFENLSDVTRVIAKLIPHLHIRLGIYHAPSGEYVVPVHFFGMSDEEIQRVSDVFSEFSYPREVSIGTGLYIEEHCEKLSSVIDLVMLKLLLTPLDEVWQITPEKNNPDEA